MAASRSRIVFKKELLDLFRDRRTVMVMVVLPLLLYPLLMIGVMQITMLQAGKMREQTAVVALLSPEETPSSLFASDTSKVEITDSTNWKEKLAKSEIDAALSLSKGFFDSVRAGKSGEITLHYLSTRDFSETVRRRIETLVEKFSDSQMKLRLATLSLDSSFIEPVIVNAQDEATEEQQSGSMLGRILGYILILMTLTGAFQAAIDLTAGEKERGTLETLLVSPATREEIVMGKFYATVTGALISATLNLVSMGVTMAYVFNLVGERGAQASIAFSVSPWSLMLLLLTLLPLAVLFSGVCLAVAVTARTYKEGQSLMTPMMMVSILPAMVSMIPGVELSPLMALVPIANVSLMTKTLLSGETPWLEIFLTIGSTAALAWLSLRWVIAQFHSESVLFRHAEDIRWNPFHMPKRRAGRRLTSESVILLAAVSIVVIAVVGAMQSGDSAVRSIVTMQAAIAVLSVVWIRRGGYDPKAAFGWVMPSNRVWLPTIISLCGAWIITIELASIQHLFIPFPEDLLKDFTKLFEDLSVLGLPQSLFFIALLPAVVEEHLCRGLMLRGLENNTGKWTAIIAVSLVFAFLHMNPYRLIPTFVLGIVLGHLAWETGSLFPAILGHFINNALSFLVQEHVEWIESLGLFPTDESALLPWQVVLAGMVLLALGLRLLPKREAVIED
jgi:sodium transport system permease protein